MAVAQNVAATSEAHQEIRQGQTGVYQFTLRSSEIDPQITPPEIPKIDGLSIEYAATSQGISQQYINGSFSQTITKTYQYQVTGIKQGQYKIPSFTVSVGGQNVTIPSVTISVVEGLNTSMWAELEMPRESIYVGEAVLAKLKLIYDPSEIRDIRQARTPPFHAKDNDAFTIGEFGNQKSRTIERDGRKLNEISFQVMITPLKTGPQPMVIQSDLVLTLPSSGAQRRQRSLFDQFTSSRYEMQQVSLYTQDEEFNILPLPEADRPTYFTGGIGMFTVDKPRLSSTEAKAGEPLTMTLTVRGQGNFHRLQAPVLEESENWRDYSPEEEFFSADSMGFTGAKTFEYTLIPRESGELVTPEINFNFFDPDNAQYVELPIPGQAIKVQENPNAARPPRNPVAARRGPELLPIATTTGSMVNAIRPIVTNPIFLASQCIPALLIGLMFLSRRRELRLQNDAVYARNIRADKQTKAEMLAARQAAEQKDAAAFYTSAVRAVQAAAGRHAEQAPESLTLADIERIGQSQSLNEESLASVREFMDATDAIRFGGVDSAKIDFDAELKRLEKTVDALGGRQ